MAKFYGNILSLSENIAKSFRGGYFFLTHTVHLHSLKICNTKKQWGQNYTEKYCGRCPHCVCDIGDYVFIFNSVFENTYFTYFSYLKSMTFYFF